LPNGTMLSMSAEYDSVNKCTQEISESMKLHILGRGKMPIKFIRQLTNTYSLSERTHCEVRERDMTSDF